MGHIWQQHTRDLSKNLQYQPLKYVAESHHQPRKDVLNGGCCLPVMAEREVFMSLMNYQTEDDVESRKVVQRNNSDAVRGKIVVTLGDILKFALFFIICFLIAIAATDWLLGYFGPA